MKIGKILKVIEYSNIVNPCPHWWGIEVRNQKNGPKSVIFMKTVFKSFTIMLTH